MEPLIGKEFAISFQTATEILQGAYAAQCGEARLGALHRIIDSTLVIPANEKVIEAAAKLYAEARAAGHALQDKAHTADRWIAASAFAYDLPLVSTDKIFVDAPGLKLLTV
uniref:PIN domain-containing protein n=1 Tax=Mobiluncus sp. TaxID=47293 RepID=UPI0030B90191